MRWRGERESGNIEDRRGMSGGGLAVGGIGGLLIAAVIYFLGGDPSQVMQQPTDQVQTAAADPMTHLAGTSVLCLLLQKMPGQRYLII
jgi:predicted metalloprotease